MNHAEPNATRCWLTWNRLTAPEPLGLAHTEIVAGAAQVGCVAAERAPISTSDATTLAPGSSRSVCELSCSTDLT